jgi:hypothetical protein
MRATDVVRVHDDRSGVVLALLANGFDSGFSTCWPPGSRLVLDLFLDAWATSTGPTPKRLASAFLQCRDRFVAGVPALISDKDDSDPPGGTLLAVAIDGATIHATWLGGDTALLARGFETVAKTTPHTLREQVGREHPDQAQNLDAIPNVVVRSFGPLAPQEVPDVAEFTAQAGDTLLLLSSRILSEPTMTPEEAAFAAAAYPSPAALAERLTDIAFRNGTGSFAAVAALRFDAVDVPFKSIA